jgi:hypothetical protein
MMASFMRCHVIDSDGDELARAAERAEPDCDRDPVPKPCQVVTAGREQPITQLCSDAKCLIGAPRIPRGRPAKRQIHFQIVGRIRMAVETVDLPDAAEPALQGAGLQPRRFRIEIPGDESRRCREWCLALGDTPLREAAKVGSIGAQRVRGVGSFEPLHRTLPLDHDFSPSGSGRLASVAADGSVLAR